MKRRSPRACSSSGGCSTRCSRPRTRRKAWRRSSRSASRRSVTSNHQGDGGSQLTRSPAWRVIAWMCGAHVASMTGFSTYVTLLPGLQDEWGMNNSQAGFISGMFFAGYMAAVPVLASLTDRMDARRIYLGSSLVAAAALAGFGLLVEGVKSAAVLQLAAGAGIAGTYMPGLRALTDNVEGTRAQSRAVAFYTAVFGLGTSLSILLSGSIADSIGWRWAFLLGSVGPVLSGLMVVRGRPPRTPQRSHDLHMLDFRPVLASRGA